MSLAAPELCSGVAGGVTRNIVCLFREPDAGNLPVRFDEREQETELGQTGLRLVTRKRPNSHREAKATAPVLDSTPDYTHLAWKKPNGKRNLRCRNNTPVVGLLRRGFSEIGFGRIERKGWGQ